MPTVNSEVQVYEQLARHLNIHHPKLQRLWHFSLAGVNNPSHATRNLYGRLNRPGWPDFFLPYPVLMPASFVRYSGLALEIKRPGERLKKRNGSWASEHVGRQAAMLEELADLGYIAQFAVGIEECIAAVESYLAGEFVAIRERKEEMI